MAKIDTEANDVFTCILTCSEARELLDGVQTGGDDELSRQLDEAQSHVHTGNPRSYLVIQIIRDPESEVAA